ncbi:MAG: hypothetical protein QM747_03295 [Nocardioides sp.]
MTESVAPPTMIRNAPIIKEEAPGYPPKWRVQCRRCGRDVPISDQNMRRLFDALTKTRAAGLDVSLMPKQ